MIAVSVATCSSYWTGRLHFRHVAGATRRTTTALHGQLSRFANRGVTTFTSAKHLLSQLTSQLHITQPADLDQQAVVVTGRVYIQLRANAIIRNDDPGVLSLIAGEARARDAIILRHDGCVEHADAIVALLFSVTEQAVVAILVGDAISH